MGTLFQAICSEATLFDAWQRVERKGAQGGIDRITVVEFRNRLNRNLERLRDDLQQGTYVPEPFQKIEIPKHNAPGETRPLQMPTIRDKVAQEAVRSVIAPILERTFADCSYAYRPGKGPQKAIRRVEHYLGAKKHWVATADIDRFFDMMDRDITLRLITQSIKEPEIVRLLALWINMGAMDSHGRWVESPRGVAQGSVISPLLSNVYLTPFDAHMTQKGLALVRYADNFILLARTQEESQAALAESQAFLQQRLKLQLNSHPQPVTSLAHGFVFLGMYFRDGVRRISNGKIAQMRTEIRHLWQRFAAREMSDLVAKLNESILSWKRYYGLVNPTEQFQELDAFIAEGLARAMALRMTLGQLSRDIDPHSLLNDLEFLQSVTPEERRSAIGRIIRRFRELRGVTRPTRPVKSAIDAAEPPPREPTVDLQTEGEGGTSSSAVAPASTTTASQTIAPLTADKAAEILVEPLVRRQKRRYLKQAVQGTELVISEPGVFLGRTSRRIVVKKQRRVIMEIPLKQLRHILIAAPGATVSAAVITACAELNVPLDFLSPRGEPIARLCTPLDSLGNTGLQQLRAIHDGSGLKLARIIVEGKLRNQFNLVKYYHKYRRRVDAGFDQAFVAVEERFDKLIAELQQFTPQGDYEAIRGQLFAFEGRGGNLYWQMIRLLLEDDVEFPGRERQGATDLVNSLLNYGYGMMYPRVHHAILLAGLNPCISFLHSFQEGKPTLAFDLIEEFRAQAVDRVVFSMITKGERLALDAQTGRLTRETVQKLIRNVLERLATPIRYRRQAKPLQEIIHLQARLLAGHLHGRARYRPFIGPW